MNKHEKKRQQKRATRKGKNTADHRRGMNASSNRNTRMPGMPRRPMITLPGLKMLFDRKEIK